MSASDQAELASAELISTSCTPLLVTQLQPGDVLLLQTPHKLAAEQRAALAELVKRALGQHVKPLVLDGDLAASVLRPVSSTDALAASDEPDATGTDPLTPPPIGRLWAAQGGLYAGVARGLPGQPDHHLILASPAPAKRLAWQAAMDWAATLQVRGHTDWALPTRAEAALLHANLKAECVPEWHWASETHEDDSSYAWGQYFTSGSQYDDRKSVEINEDRKSVV